jgi:pSer/pThr/pTyr-binding forkhead associated (FHA) protein
MKLSILVDYKNSLEDSIQKIHNFEQGTCTIGRSEADLVLSHPLCSRQHALLFQDAGGSLRIRDLNSTNGISVGGKKVKEAVLTVGSTFKIGKMVLRIVMFQSDKAAKVPSVPEVVIHQWPANYYAMPKSEQERFYNVI